MATKRTPTKHKRVEAASKMVHFSFNMQMARRAVMTGEVKVKTVASPTGN